MRLKDKACGTRIPWRHIYIALILKRNIVGPAFVEAKLLHVQGSAWRKLGYVLTPTGYRVVQGPLT